MNITISIAINRISILLLPPNGYYDCFSVLLYLKSIIIVGACSEILLQITILHTPMLVKMSTFCWYVLNNSFPGSLYNYYLSVEERVSYVLPHQLSLNSWKVNIHSSLISYFSNYTRNWKIRLKCFWEGNPIWMNFNSYLISKFNNTRAFETTVRTI